jgi:hypothetical protein
MRCAHPSLLFSTVISKTDNKRRYILEDRMAHKERAQCHTAIPCHNCIEYPHVRQIICTPLTFRGPCIVIWSYNKTRDALISQIYFWNGTLHVSGSFSVHYQESSTVYTAIGICHTGYTDCLLAIPIAVYTVLDS